MGALLAEEIMTGNASQDMTGLTITRLAKDEFLLVPGDTLRRVTPAWLPPSNRGG